MVHIHNKILFSYKENNDIYRKWMALERLTLKEIITLGFVCFGFDLINHWTKASVYLVYRLQSIIPGSQGRNSK